ncbi:Swi5-dependent recombination DNA repair protein 1 [Cryptococcus neoformans AD1-7a]|nr:Swi5-dependent recombination DNA repair protein 1 [Cryptococcus neoformans var. grubii AD1-7a]
MGNKQSLCAFPHFSLACVHSEAMYSGPYSIRRCGQTNPRSLLQGEGKTTEQDQVCSRGSILLGRV